MTAERQVKAPIPKTIGKPEQVRIPPESPLVSEKTIEHAIPIAEKLAEGKKPVSEDVSTLVASVVTDLKAQGIALSSDDIRAIEARTKEGFSPVSSSPKPLSLEKKKPLRLSELPEIDLSEHQKVIDAFVQHYGLDKKAWNRISGILVGSELTGLALDTATRYIGTGPGFEKVQERFGLAANALKLEKKTFGEFIRDVRNKKYGTDAIKDAGLHVVRAIWPILLSFVYAPVDQYARKIANNMFLAERARLQEQVNNRIADSLYMRNFEFLHDKSSAEMLEVINRGKDATVDLVSAVYEELIPLKQGQWGMIGSHGVFDLLVLDKEAFSTGSRLENAVRSVTGFADLISAGVKKVVLDTRIKPNTRLIQQQRAEELAHWDTVNTKLLTTLQALESARTAGNAEAGSDAMFQALAQRDFVEQGGLQQKRMHERDLNRAFGFFDTIFSALPVAQSLYDASKKTEVEIVKPDGGRDARKVNATDVFKDIGLGYYQYMGAKGSQAALRQSFLQLTHLYADRIIPDIQDIQRMEEILGPYLSLDHPMGLKERARVSVKSLSNFDISINDLRFKHILRGVNLDIPQGSFVTIKGPSGVGKSTLFRHLVGLYTGESGTVSYGGVAIDKIKKFGDESLYNRIAYANQNPQYFEDMTLRENILLWTKKDIPQAKIEAVLKDLKLDGIIDRLDTKTKHFSGGELRRIGIARALLKDPKVLFLDEPTANLDAASTLQVMNIITELRRKRPDMTVVAITHDPVFEKIAEKIVDFEEINPKSAPSTLGERQVFTATAKAR